ncbi:MAG TPA: hypothetical protein VNM70_09690 [Burkholderiales bacterium]|jgi:hypothetical protein|nr:hypothetical protein [Burkholderiales bacterium]
MALSAAHWLLRAEEARRAAQLCGDTALRGLLQEIARSYDELAAGRYLQTRRTIKTAACEKPPGSDAASSRI